MKKILLFFCVFFALSGIHAQTYNTLWIPDTLTGPNFSLDLKDSSKQIIAGNKTNTCGANGAVWGPTLIFNKGDKLTFSVNNKLKDTTTIHWHGMHIPAVMDGGPHQPIAPGTSWKPNYTVMNNAATFWYHPHMDRMAMTQITTGLGGMIIVRDSVESALKLPRQYGVDDIPLALTDRRFNISNQFVEASYGDTMMVNATLNPAINLGAQIVRFRILNASLERSYNLGFSDNRKFYVITTDGGLVDKPVAVTRFLISAAERVEILLDLTADKGNSIDLKAYNASLPNSVPGFEPTNFGGGLANKLGARDFNVLHINIVSATTNAITSIPSTLVTNTFWSASSASVTRKVLISDTTEGGPPIFLLNHRQMFDMMEVDYTVQKDATEIWEIQNTSGVAHPFHIHDIEFHILSRNGASISDQENGWKDVVLVKKNETVRFIAKFDDFADSINPYMFHCHIAKHEDDGLMGQFLVTSKTSGIYNMNNLKSPLLIYPNPSADIIKFSTTSNIQIKEVKVLDLIGREVETNIDLISESINISHLNHGLYILMIKNSKGELSYSKFTKI